MLHRTVADDYCVVLFEFPIKLREQTLAQCLQEEIFVSVFDLHGSDSVISAHDIYSVTIILPKDMQGHT